MDGDSVAWISLGIVVVVQIVAWIRQSARTATILEHLDRMIRDHEERLRRLEEKR